MFKRMFSKSLTLGVFALAVGAGCDRPVDATSQKLDAAAQVTQLHQDARLFSKDELPAFLASYPNMKAIRSELQSRVAVRAQPAPEAKNSLCNVLLHNIVIASDDELNDAIDNYLYFCG